MAQNGAPGGGWPPPSSAVPPKRREGVTSALDEIAEATNGSDALAPGEVRPEYVPRENVPHAPAVSAAAEQASLIEEQGGQGMTPEELAVFRAGAARKATEAEALAASQVVAIAPTLKPKKTRKVVAPKVPKVTAPVVQSMTFAEERAAAREAVKSAAPSTSDEGPTFGEQQAAAREAVRNAPPSESGTTFRFDAAMARGEILRSAPSTEGETIGESYARMRESTDPLGPSAKDATHKENVAALRSLREKLTGEKATERIESTAAELYEMRVSAFAEANGLSAEFVAMRAARDAYREARMKVPSKEAAKSVKTAYDAALFKWRTELHTKSLQTEGSTRAEALIFAKRDTILGPAHIDFEARQAALSEKGKTALGKAGIWLTRTPVSLLRLTNKPFELAGKGAAMVLHKDTEAREAYAKQYARAARIITGAVFASFLATATSPVSVTGGLSMIALFTARGVIGSLAGVGAAKLSGGMFDRLFGNKQKENIKAQMHTRPLTIEEYQKMQERYRKQNAKERSKQRNNVQMLAAIVGGAGTGLLSSPVVHDLLERVAAYDAVKDAAERTAEVNANSPEAATQAARLARKIAEHKPDAAPAAPPVSGPEAPAAAPVSAPTPAPEVATSSAGAAARAAEQGAAIAEKVTSGSESLLPIGVVAPGEGFGELVQHFKHSFAENMPGQQASSPAVLRILNADPNDIARQVAALRGTESMLMQPGDRLFADEHGTVWFKANGEDAQRLFENDPSQPDGVRVYKLAVEAPPEPATAEMRSTVSPEGASTSDPSDALNRAQIQEPTTADKPTGAPASPPAPVAAPEAPQPVAPVERTAPVTPLETQGATIESAGGESHPFATPGAEPLMNQNNVDLNKPQIVRVDDRVFARGTSTEDSYARAVDHSRTLANNGPTADTRVYFVVREINDLGQPYNAVRMVFTPAEGATQMAPYGAGLSTTPEFTMPPLPKDADYKLLSSR